MRLKKESSSCSVFCVNYTLTLPERQKFKQKSLSVLPFCKSIDLIDCVFIQYSFSEDLIYQRFYLGKTHLILLGFEAYLLALRHIFFTTGRVPNLLRNVMEASPSKVFKIQLDTGLLGVSADPSSGGMGDSPDLLFWLLLFFQYLQYDDYILKKELSRGAENPSGLKIYVLGFLVSPSSFMSHNIFNQ